MILCCCTGVKVPILMMVDWTVTRAEKKTRKKEKEKGEGNRRWRRSRRRKRREEKEEKDKKLSYRRGTAQCVVSVEILPTATQQCRNYLYDKS